MRKILNKFNKSTDLKKYSNKGDSQLLTTQILQSISKYIPIQQRWQVEFGQVMEIADKDDSNNFGAVLCRFEMIEQLVWVQPLNINDLQIPVKGEIVLCKRYPILQGDTNTYNQTYYYFGILKILKSINNNSLEYIHSPDTQQVGSGEILGKQFVNKQISSVQYKQGDKIIQSRFGSSIRFTSHKGEYPLIQITNENLNNQNLYINQDIDNYGSNIQVMHMPDSKHFSPSSNKGKRVDLKGDTVVINSGNIFLNSKDKYIEVHSNTYIKATASNDITIQSDSIQLKVGSSFIAINKNSIDIQSTNINLNGTVKIRGVEPGVTPGFCSIPLDPFTGAPQTIDTVGL